MSKYNLLTPEEAHVLLDKGTEPAFSGEYNDLAERGVYLCRQCLNPLYESTSKFSAHCGWPSFDDNIPGSVIRLEHTNDPRTEILCANCKGHLGHVFSGERYTSKNTRHCVNSLSMKFIPEKQYQEEFDTAVFASGCFWGTEYWFSKAEGVIATTAGYSGGKVEHPTYRQVCAGNTGHAESIRVIFNPKNTTYDDLIKLFFETHDPAQHDRQGPDVGHQYRSVIFYNSPEQKLIAEKYRSILESQGINVATEIIPLKMFYPENDLYHQKYYDKNGDLPYCHIYQKKF
jgi:peptide methionine sulfoxide reductase msrA/msrB